MAKLPSVSTRRCVQALEKVGFYQTRHSGGNHIYVRRDNPLTQIAIPANRNSLAKGTLRRIIRDAGMTVDEFVKLL